jgi:hypothetical protein
MSNYVGHRNAGIAVATISAIGLYVFRDEIYNITYQEIALSSFFIFVFSLFPDVDVKSIPSKIFYFAVALFLGFC